MNCKDCKKEFQEYELCSLNKKCIDCMKKDLKEMYSNPLGRTFAGMQKMCIKNLEIKIKNYYKDLESSNINSFKA